MTIRKLDEEIHVLYYFPTDNVFQFDKPTMYSPSLGQVVDGQAVGSVGIRQWLDGVITVEGQEVGKI